MAAECDVLASAEANLSSSTADVGFGSFYTHFPTKAELFETAVEDVLEEMGEQLDELSSGLQDPAATFAQSVRLAGRLARRRPQVAWIMVRHGESYMDSDRALRDITAGIDAGRFLTTNPKLARAAVTGSLLATLHLSLTDPNSARPAGGFGLAKVQCFSTERHFLGTGWQALTHRGPRGR